MMAPVKERIGSKAKPSRTCLSQGVNPSPCSTIPEQPTTLPHKTASPSRNSLSSSRKSSPTRAIPSARSVSPTQKSTPGNKLITPTCRSGSPSLKSNPINPSGCPPHVSKCPSNRSSPTRSLSQTHRSYIARIADSIFENEATIPPPPPEIVKNKPMKEFKESSETPEQDISATQLSTAEKLDASLKSFNSGESKESTVFHYGHSDGRCTPLKTFLVENIAVQYSRATTSNDESDFQKKVPKCTNADLNMWYLLLLSLPGFNDTNNSVWMAINIICYVIHAVSLSVRRTCSTIQNVAAYLLQEHVARDLFATVMDILLFFYAVGFLILSVCGSSSSVSRVPT